VPLFAFLITGRLITRLGPGRVICLGATTYAIGIGSWALRAGISPDYAGQVLPGMLLTGIGVGLTLPTFMASGAAALPPQAFATGSAAINMLRQVGLAIGVAVLVAVLGSPRTPAASVTAFQHGWTAIAVVAFGAALAGAALLGTGRSRPCAGGRPRQRAPGRWQRARVLAWATGSVPPERHDPMRLECALPATGNVRGPADRPLGHGSQGPAGYRAPSGAARPGGRECQAAQADTKSTSPGT
jgi:MFS family permease